MKLFKNETSFQRIAFSNIHYDAVDQYFKDNVEVRLYASHNDDKVSHRYTSFFNQFCNVCRPNLICKKCFLYMMNSGHAPFIY